MESWKDASEVKNPLLSDGIGLSADALGRPRKMSMGWNGKLSCNSDDMLGSSRERVESMEFMELGLPDMLRNSDHSDPNLDVLDGEIGNYFSSTLLSPSSMITSNSSFRELESGLSLSSNFIPSNCQKSLLNDLKLGRLVDWGEAKNSRCSNEGLVLSSVGSSLTSKRVRTANLYSQNPICQVHGCNKDLSSSKDYYKRHKVCDVHSKTSRVIVNGIQQRFCQQCSRFHLLAEFDDGKRSCRKRLAGHNERRRKPQLDILSGARFLQTSLPKRSSFVFPDILPGGFFNPQRNFQGNTCNHIKVGKEPIYSPQLAIPSRNSQSHSNPVFNMQGIGKQCSSEIPFSQGIGKQCSSEIPFSQTGHTYIETTSVQESSGVPNPSGALSLLSARSKNKSSHMTGIPMVSPLLAPDTCAPCAVDQNSEKAGGTSIEEKFPPNGFCSSGMISMKVDQLRPPGIFDACSSIAFQVQGDRIFQWSDSMKSRSCVPPEDGPTVDLIQLSSHLQRVEQERNCIQLKQENEAFCFQTA